MMEPETIAERTLYAVDRDGRSRDVGLQIGKPYEAETGEWVCPVAMIGLQGRLRDVRGADSWQALQLAQRMIGVLLDLFVETGGRLFWEKNGEEVKVHELFNLPDPAEEHVPDVPMNDGRLRGGERARVDKLSSDQLRRIDDAIIANASTQWRKVARVIAGAMEANESIKHVPDIFYAERVEKLVDDKRLESKGDLNKMRFSEVRLPSVDMGPS